MIVKLTTKYLEWRLGKELGKWNPYDVKRAAMIGIYDGLLISILVISGYKTCILI